LVQRMRFTATAGVKESAAATPVESIALLKVICRSWFTATVAPACGVVARTMGAKEGTGPASALAEGSDSFQKRSKAVA